MFCIKCGEKLSEEAVFCSKCGEKIVKEEPVKTAEDDVAGSMVDYGLATNKEFARKIISIYDKLIEPLKKIEELTLTNSNLESEKEMVSDNIRSWKMSKPEVPAIGRWILLGFVTFIIGFIGTIAASRETKPVVFFTFIFIALFVAIGVPIIIYVIHCNDWKGEYKRNDEMNNSRLQEINESIENNTNSISCVLAKIQDAITVVPVEYRRSDYLEEMVRSYQIGRAETIKEVFNLFEDRKQRGEIRQATIESSQLIVDSINYNFRITNELLFNIESMLTEGIDINVHTY